MFEVCVTESVYLSIRLAWDGGTRWFCIHLPGRLRQFIYLEGPRFLQQEF